MFLHRMSVNRLRAGLTATGLILAVLLVAGCGKRGPLYIPKDDAPPPAPATTVETQDKEKNKH